MSGKILLPLRFSHIIFGCALAWANLAHCGKGEVTAFPPGQEKKVGPWFTGTLLSTSGHVAPVGYYNIEPYLFVIDHDGRYNNEWKTEKEPTEIRVRPLLKLKFGVTKWMDVQVSPNFSYAKREGESSTRLGDTLAGLNIQLLKDAPGKWWPAIKLMIREFFPTGKYQHLNPHKHRTDVNGEGAFSTGLGVALSRFFHVQGTHYLHARINYQYFIPSRVHLEGFNTYGGGFGTRGTMRPGNFSISNIGLEFNMTKNWALALDLQNIYTNKDSFSGKHGINLEGHRARVGRHSRDQFSLAPALEYNFNANIGIIAGVWLTAAGRNTGKFASGVIALNVYDAF